MSAGILKCCCLCITAQNTGQILLLMTFWYRKSAYGAWIPHILSRYVDARFLNCGAVSRKALGTKVEPRLFLRRYQARVHSVFTNHWVLVGLHMHLNKLPTVAPSITEFWSAVAQSANLFPFL